jgi:DNA-binding response OmpR family regulator
MKASPSRSGAKILIVSDEPLTAQDWGYSLAQSGLDIRMISLAEDVMEVWAEETPDLIIIEDFNEQMEEIELCRQLRLVTIVPILFLTNKISETFQYEVYRAGADECIPYPVNLKLFHAKVRAWLRRTKSFPLAGLDEVQVDGFRLFADQKRLALPSGAMIRLTTLETRLLYLLMSHPGREFESEEMVERVWGHYGEGDNRLLKNHIYRLRRKIEVDPANPCYLVSVGYSGYKFRINLLYQNS